MAAVELVRGAGRGGRAAEPGGDREQVVRGRLGADPRRAGAVERVADLAVAAVVPHHDGEREAEVDRGRELGEREQQPAVAGEDEHRPVGRRELRAHRHRERGPERPQAVGREPRAGPRGGQVVVGGVGGLCGVQGDDAIGRQRGVDRVEPRQVREAVLGPVEAGERRAHLLGARRARARQALPQRGRDPSERGRRVADQPDLGRRAAGELGGVDVDAHDPPVEARRPGRVQPVDLGELGAGEEDGVGAGQQRLDGRERQRGAEAQGMRRRQHALGVAGEDDGGVEALGDGGRLRAGVHGATAEQQGGPLGAGEQRRGALDVALRGLGRGAQRRLGRAPMRETIPPMASAEVMRRAPTIGTSDPQQADEITRSG